MKILSFLMITLDLFCIISYSFGNDAYIQCYDHPNPIDRNYKVPIHCPIIKEKKIPIQELAASSTNKFKITFTCGITNITLCNKVKNEFETIGTIITSVLIINSPITVNASFIDFCIALGECNSNSKYITLGSAIPARTIQLQDDDGRIRTYPQALVKQFQFDKHPENQRDFLLVALHEMIHGLGFVSNWDDYINSNPEILTPDISLTSTKFNGFLESAFDKYMIYIPTRERISSIITKEFDKFKNGSNNQFSSLQKFAKTFKESPQYNFSLDMIGKGITPFSLGFLLHESTKASDAIILETSLNPYSKGSSISYFDLKHITIRETF
ncbi:hypothetical protein C2G38_2186729 [Gigaspora rosea]|uniref:Sequence orphan n=1 Tax=Gigaspora rosea TaxID=44941 RepID=A0A397V7P5_9GLOM|nr:hypothetical protein C2G38_2186729 [Gigaspora rosea]CAG8474545.1 10010_t:CDS:2 [Gigaspora rosea]